MDRLTREQIERLRAALLTSDVPIGQINALCDHIHRGWCNYCKGTETWCDNCPEGGCALRDYLRALQSTARVAEGLDAKMADLLIDTTWRKCVGQCMADNCGRLFISRERFDEHIAPLIRALKDVHSTELRK